MLVQLYRILHTDSKHNNPLCRVVPVYNTQNNDKTNYDKEKYREVILESTETVRNLRNIASITATGET